MSGYQDLQENAGAQGSYKGGVPTGAGMQATPVVPGAAAAQPAQPVQAQAQAQAQPQPQMDGDVVMPEQAYSCKGLFSFSSWTGVGWIRLYFYLSVVAGLLQLLVAVAQTPSDNGGLVFAAILIFIFFGILLVVIYRVMSEVYLALLLIPAAMKHALGGAAGVGMGAPVVNPAAAPPMAAMAAPPAYAP